jgi:hypothetical protein
MTASSLTRNTAFVLLGGAWLLAAPALVVLGIGQQATVLGQEPSAHGLAQSRRAFQAAFACGVVAPAFGWGLALGARRRWASRVFAAALGLGALAASGLQDLVPADPDDPPPPPAGEPFGGLPWHEYRRINRRAAQQDARDAAHLPERSEGGD